MSIKLVFLSLSRIDSLNERGIYHDLLREFVKKGYEITVVCPLERSTNISSRVIVGSNFTIVQVKTLNFQKCNIFEKGLAMLSLNFLFKKAMVRYINECKFDLILYSTPPITLIRLISWLKSKNGARTYLLLKDIFPQNAVDMEYFRKYGLFHRYFSMVEKQLYKISDKIGCMSQANVDYLIRLHPELKEKVEINPNSVDLTRIPIVKETKEQIRRKWNIPNDAVVFIYGGNLGKPQGVEFLLQIIDRYINDTKAYFLIVGDGTEFEKLHFWFKSNNPINAQLLKKIPKPEFDSLARNCDVGLILLRKEFTIPNFPSRLLTYLENKLPICAFTDNISDIGIIAQNNGFGLRMEYGELEEAIINIDRLINDFSLRKEMGTNGFAYLINNYNVELSFNLIDQTIKTNKNK
jgi:glycosyltransferase involved in cell wall biosynthesis